MDVDHTSIWNWQGWLFLAVVVDLYSLKVVGGSMKPSLARQPVLDALLMAVVHRRPKANAIVHSDQGKQYGTHLGETLAGIVSSTCG